MNDFIKEFEGQDMVKDEMIASFLCKSADHNDVNAKNAESRIIQYLKMDSPANSNISN